MHTYSIPVLHELAHSPLVAAPESIHFIDPALFVAAPRSTHNNQREKPRQKSSYKKPSWDMQGLELASQPGNGPRPDLQAELEPSSSANSQRKQVDLWEGDFNFQQKRDGSSRFSSLFGGPKPQQSQPDQLKGASALRQSAPPGAQAGGIGYPMQSPPPSVGSMNFMNGLYGSPQKSNEPNATTPHGAPPGIVSGAPPGISTRSGTSSGPGGSGPGVSTAPPGMGRSGPSGPAGPATSNAPPGIASPAAGGIPLFGTPSGPGGPAPGLGGAPSKSPAPALSSNDSAFFNSLLSKSQPSPSPQLSKAAQPSQQAKQQPQNSSPLFQMSQPPLSRGPGGPNGPGAPGLSGSGPDPFFAPPGMPHQALPPGMQGPGPNGSPQMQFPFAPSQGQLQSRMFGGQSVPPQGWGTQYPH